MTDFDGKAIIMAQYSNGSLVTEHNQPMDPPTARKLARHYNQVARKAGERTRYRVAILAADRRGGKAK